MHGIKEASLQKIGLFGILIGNYFGILMAVKKAECRLHEQPYFTFSSLLSACFYNLTEISGAEYNSCCGDVRLTYGGTYLLMGVDLLLEKQL